MSFKKISSLIAFCYLLPSMLYGQDITFHHLTEADGMPKGIILCFEQDHHGFLWLGTTDGLYRYDGNEFRAFYHNREDSSSLSNNGIKYILEDRKGRIWVGTKLGLNCYLPGEDRFVRYLYEKGDDFESENYVHNILEDRYGKIWYGTYNGLFYFDPEKEELLQFLPQEDNQHSIIGSTIWQVLEDRKGRLWIGTNSGLSTYANDGSFQFERYEPIFNQDRALNTERIWALAEQEDGTIWFGSYNGLYRVDEGKEPWQFQRFRYKADHQNSLSYNHINSNLIEGNERLWVGTWAGGLNEIHLSPNDPDSIRFIHHRHQFNNPKSVGYDNIVKVFRDRSEILWVATTNSLDKVAPSLNKFNAVLPNPGLEGALNNETVKSTLRDSRGNLWVGT
ncbi:MAG: two-component regulator propeller domain-containing protein, partial [Bacteroidota bacterium]